MSDDGTKEGAGPMSGWHVDKRVSIGHIVTTLAVAIGMILYLGRVEGRVEQNATNLRNEIEQRKIADEVLEQRLSRNEVRVERDLSEIKSALRRIEEKLGEKADR